MLRRCRECVDEDLVEVVEDESDHRKIVSSTTTGSYSERREREMCSKVSEDGAEE